MNKSSLTGAMAAVQRVAQARACDLHAAVADEDSAAEFVAAVAINAELDEALAGVGWNRESFAAAVAKRVGGCKSSS